MVVSCQLSLHAQVDLWQVYQLAKQNDPQILASKSQLLLNKENINQSMANLLPNLSGSISVAKSFDLNNDTETTSDSKSLNLSQTIYEHSQWINLDISKKRALSAALVHSANEQALMLRVAEAYFNLLEAADGVFFSLAEKEASQQQLAQTKQRFEVGLINITDVHQAQANHDQNNANVITNQNTLDNAVEALREITGQYHEEVKSLNLINLTSPSPNDIDYWLKTAKDKNIDLQRSRLEKKIAREEIKSSNAQHLPRLRASANYSERGGSAIINDLPVPDSRNSSINITLSVPIYSGGAISSRTKQAQHSLQQATHQLEQTHRATIRNTRSAYLGILSAISSTKALQQAVISSESALKATEAGFEVGTQTIIDVLVSRTNLFDAKRSLASAKYQYILQNLRLKSAAGVLTEEDIQQVNQLLKTSDVNKP